MACLKWSHIQQKEDVDILNTEEIDNAPKILRRLTDNLPAYKAGYLYNVLESEKHQYVKDSWYLVVENDINSQYTLSTTDYDFQDKWEIVK